MSHTVPDQIRQLLPLGASVKTEALLGDALAVLLARIPAESLPFPTFLAEPPCPLHALLPQQWVICLVGAAGFFGLVLGVFTVINID